MVRAGHCLSKARFLALLTRGVDLGIWFALAQGAVDRQVGSSLMAIRNPVTGTPLQPASPITHHTVQLYVGNISFTITEADLQHIFEQFGSVIEIKVVTDRETGQPRGFAFVTLGNDAEGRAAIKSLDGKEFGGRPLKVSEARPKEDRHGRSSSRPRR